MKEIPVFSHGQQVATVKVDDADFDWLNQWRWFLHRSTRSNKVYAKRSAHADPCPACHRTTTVNVMMHRAILEWGGQLVPHLVDHVNGDGLDNQRSNIRRATHSENLQNRGPSTHPSKHWSKFKGVSFHVKSGRWHARHKLNGKEYSLGYFQTEAEAAAVATAWRRQNHPFSPEARA